MILASYDTQDLIVEKLYPGIAQSLIDIRDTIMQDMESKFPIETKNSEYILYNSII